MQDFRAGSSAVWLAAAVLAAGLSMSGCGTNLPPDDLWSEAVRVQMEYHSGVSRVQAGDPQGNVHGTSGMREVYVQAAESLERAVSENPRAREGLRRFLSDMAEDFRRMGDGEVSGAAARELAEQQEARFSYVQNRSLPSEYQ